MLTLIIDNYDSFTYNLYQAIGELGGEPRVFRNDAISMTEITRLDPTHLILSPGPGGPRDGGISASVVRKFAPRTPLLGVCLGHQIIAHTCGARVSPAVELVHGKNTSIFHDRSGPFFRLPSPFQGGRYHSLTVDPANLPGQLKVTAWTDAGIIMGIRHKTYPMYGVQFHPESILTSHGTTLLQDFLRTNIKRGSSTMRESNAG